ncbi:collagen alpha-1(I) chain-like, partial [Onychostruthus taczanowskii]|uniref:collagen alpha-1(I) chain-like n=1 Tax=Onychostruthus taczanowskii TaxID=356909 RepID=UPI001B801BE5
PALAREEEPPLRRGGGASARRGKEPEKAPEPPREERGGAGAAPPPSGIPVRAEGPRGRPGPPLPCQTFPACGRAAGTCGTGGHVPEGPGVSGEGGDRAPPSRSGGWGRSFGWSSVTGRFWGALSLSGVSGILGTTPHGFSLAPAGGVAAQGVATPVPPTGGGASVSLFGTLRDPPALPHGGYTNPFTAPVAPRPSTNPFESSGSAFISPPVPGGFPSPFQADGLPFGGFSVAKASTNPFVTVPAPTAPFGIRPRATNPFL